MPGRTVKSLQHQWAKIKTQVAELEKAAGQQPSTPTKAKGTPYKPKAIPPTIGNAFYLFCSLYLFAR